MSFPTVVSPPDVYDQRGFCVAEHLCADVGGR